MTGGAGFISSGNHSGRDNRNLGKIRPKSTSSETYDYTNNLDLVDKNSLNEGIKIRVERKERLERIRKWTFRTLVILGILLFLLQRFIL